MDTQENPFISHMETQISDPNFRASQRALERIKSILYILSASKINRPSLEAFCFHGIPDECSSLRPLCWKILLGYLSNNTSRWQSSLVDHRKNYSQYIDEYYTRLVAALKKARREEKRRENKMASSCESSRRK